MKKIYLFVVLGLLWCSFGFADYYKIGQEIQDEFRLSKKIKFPLEPGVWKVTEKKVWFYGDIKNRFIGLALMDKNEIVSYREFQEGNMTGSFQSELNAALHEYFYLDKYDGCYQRPEYTLIKKFNKGNSTNCLLVRHIDVNKVLYNPDDPKRLVDNITLRKWVKDYNIKLPNFLLGSWHAYFSRTVSSNLYTVSYYINPKYFDGPKEEFSTEESSEYHPLNINKHPKFKNYMNKFIKASAVKHVEFEKIVSAKTRHKLNLSSIK